MLKKKCPACGKKKELSFFHRNKKRSDGRAGICGECARASVLKDYYKHKERYFKNAKIRDRKLDEFIFSFKNNPCKDCGIKYPHYVMDFDHIESKKKEFGIAEMRRRRMSFEKIKKEIEKCDLVCSNCHRERTNKRNPSRYSKWKD